MDKDEHQKVLKKIRFHLIKDTFLLLEDLKMREKV